MARTKSEILSEVRRNEILEAALEVFGRKGYENCSIDEIAAEAGLAKGTVYLYFKSKHDLYRAVLRDALDERAKLTLSAIERAPTAHDKITAFISTHLSYYNQHPQILRMWEEEVSNSSGPPTFTRREINQWHREPIRLIAEALVAEGLVPDQATGQTAAWAASDLSRGAIVRRLLGMSTSTIDQDVFVLTTIVLGGIRFLNRSHT